MLYVMSLTLAELSKLAIKSAYSQDWEKAVEFNSQILDQDSKNNDALVSNPFEAGLLIPPAMDGGR